MNKYVRVLFFTILVGAILTGCNKDNIAIPNVNGNVSTNNQIIKTSKMTLDDIKNIYNGGNNGSIVEVTNYKKYALVEYQKENMKYFDWYNLETGDRDLLPVWETHTKLKEIVNENDIFFISDGFHIESNYSGFPYIIKCLRAKETVGSQDDFFAKRIEKYFGIDERTEFGNGAESKITSLKSSICDIDILFEPIDEKELAFGGITLPHVKISYLQNSNQLILETPKTKTEKSCIMQNMHANNENPFIKSIKVETANEGTKITISLKDTSKYYTVQENHILKDNLPVLNLSFKTEVQYNEY